MKIVVIGFSFCYKNLLIPNFHELSNFQNLISDFEGKLSMTSFLQLLVNFTYSLQAAFVTVLMCIKTLFTRDIFAHNIAIKRLFWDTGFYWPTKVSALKTYLDLCFLCALIYFFVKSLPWPLYIHGSKIFFISIYFYRNIVRQNVSCE